MDNNLNKLKLIVAREQSYYNKNEPRDWKYYNAYMLVLNEIDKLLKEKKWDLKYVKQYIEKEYQN